MIGLLSSIVSTVTALVNFLIHGIVSLFLFVARIPSYVAILTTSVGFLPATVMPFAIASISIAVVLFFINR